MLQKHGFEVITAYKGEHAVEIVDEVADISLVLMDIDLGRGIDGTEAARKILEKKDLPVVFLSSHTEPEVVQKTEGITSYGYIVKNSGETVMLTSIRMAFRLYSAHMELKRQKENLRQALVKQEITEEKLIEKSDELERYFDASLDLLCIANTEGKFVRLNPEWEKVLGYSISELEGHTFMDFVHAEDVASTLEAVSKLSRQELIQNFENRYKCKDGSYRWMEWRSRPHGDMIYAVARDVTDRKRAEEELRESEEKFRTLMEQSIDMFFLHDMDGKIIDVNRQGEEMTGYSRSELLSMSIPDLDPDYYQREDRGAFWKKIHYNEPFQVQARLIRKDGSIFWADVVLSKVKISGRTLFMTLSRDITERLELYEALKRSEEKYRMLYENAPMPYQSLDENGCFLEVNPAWLETLGGYTKEEVIGKSFSEFIHPDSLHDFRKNLAAFKKTGKAENNVYKLRTKNGEYIDASFKGCIAFSETGKFLRTHCVFEDMTKLKAAEESAKNHAKRLELTMKGGRVAWWEMNVSTGKVSFSEQKTDMLGYSHGNFQHYEDFTALLHPDDYEAAMNAMRRHLEGKSDRYDVEYRIRTSSGEYRWFHDVGSIVENTSDGAPLHVAGIVVDVTQRKDIELTLQKQKEELLETLKQKDYLMQELNHRVKNNLNMVNSLIDLKDAEIDESLSDIHNQINAISLVHHKLQNVEDAKQIDIAAYLYDFLDAVFSSFSDKNIEIQIDTDQKFIETNMMIPLGLLINEIATNAVKHGFNDKVQPRFTVELSKAGEQQCVVQVSNTGNAFPDAIDINKPETLGMQLIVSLVAQLNGTMELQKVPHPLYTIRFPFS